MYALTVLVLQPWGPWALLGCGAGALVAAAVIYAVGAPHADKASHPRGLRAFVGFERLWVRPVATFAYLLGALAMLLVGAASVVALCLGGDAPVEIAWYALTTVASLAAAEVLWRVACELVLLFVRLCEDVRRGVQALSRLSAAEKPAEVEVVVATPVPVAAPPVRPTPEPAPAAPVAAAPVAEPPAAPVVAALVAEPPVSAAQPAVFAEVGEKPAASHGGQVAAAVSVEAEAVAYGQPAMAAEELPTVFDAATYEAYAARGAFDALPEERASWTDGGGADAASGWEGAAPVAEPRRAPEPEPVARGYGYPAWNCLCGAAGNTGAYCGNCGRARSL